MEITYEMIKSLIKKEELVAGNQIHLEFCAKNQENPIATVAVIMPDQDELMKNITKQAGKQAAKNMAVNTITGKLGGLVGGIGGNLMNEAGSNMFNQGIDANDMLKTEITPEKKEKAIVDAFKNLQMLFKFNEQTADWEFVTPSV